MSEVYDVDDLDGWGFGWDNEELGWYWQLEWLPQKQQWQRAFRVGRRSSWSMQHVTLDAPRDHTDARRIAKEHAKGCDLP